MSKPEESVLKETGDLLETARNAVLNEINNKRSFLGRIFGKSDSDSLKHAQSSISKAINQMKNFNKDETGLVVKLQQHLNQKAEEVKQLEKQFEESERQSSSLRDKIRFYEAEIKKLKTSNAQERQVELPQEHHRIENDLRAKIQQLEDSNREIQIRFEGARSDQQESEKLAVEYYQRLKRLKAEITS
jgi:chromosome segregation ATPase